MDATTRFTTERVGALPVIAGYLEKLRLREMVDEHVPWQGGIPLGTLVEVMVCNRLLNPKAQYKIGEWAQKSRVCEYYGVNQEALNDDLLGRALERIALNAFTVQSQLVMHVIRTFNLDVNKIHYDISNVELYGAYERRLNENGEAEAEGRGSKYLTVVCTSSMTFQAINSRCTSSKSFSLEIPSRRYRPFGNRPQIGSNGPCWLGWKLRFNWKGWIYGRR